MFCRCILKPHIEATPQADEPPSSNMTENRALCIGLTSQVISGGQSRPTYPRQNLSNTTNGRKIVGN